MLIKINTPSTPTSCWYLLVFLHSEWASARGIDQNIGGKTKEELNNNLRLFYAETRNKEGGNYSRSTLLGFRNGIERFLNNPPFKKGIHIATDPAFQQSNQMLDAKLKNMKQQQEESVKHKPCIENEDLRRLKEIAVMSPLTPQGLLNNVWFHITLYFAVGDVKGKGTWRKAALFFSKTKTESATRQWRTTRQVKIIKEVWATTP